MVTPTPFQRQLSTIGEQANRDPAGAYVACQQLYNKTTAAEEVQQLAGLAVNLGCLIDRLDETAAMLQSWREHPAVDGNDAVMNSMWRAEAVVHTVAGRDEQAKACAEQGVHSASDQARMSIMAAQTFLARQQPQQALPLLKQCATLCKELGAKDPILPQVATIADNIGKLAQQQLVKAQTLLLQASEAAESARHSTDDPSVQHQGLFQLAKAHVLIGNPTAALDVVQKMMAIETKHDLDAAHRLFSAGLACKAQLIRGQVKIARQAFGFCQQTAKALPGDHPLIEQARAMVDDLRNQLKS